MSENKKPRGIVSAEEAEVAAYLKERNLQRINETSAEVHPVDSWT